MPVDSSPEGEFAQLVYQWVGAIPTGHVASYGQIARLCGFPKHARFVGRLMSQLPPDTKLPWWRVLRSDGFIALPVSGEAEQVRRLEAEQVVVLAGRVNLRVFGWSA
jgi:methylated-DNA-protein-cysteine methyltransferase related protein